MTPQGAGRAVVLLALLAPLGAGAELPETVERIKPSVVGIGTFQKTRSPAVLFVGTGFVVADGRHVVTNAHTVNKPLDSEQKEVPIILVAQEGQPRPREVRLLASDRRFDLAILAFEGAPLRPMKIGDSRTVREGQTLAFTGFPIGMVLGFHPATHRGMVAAITPVVLPGMTARQLNPEMINRVRSTPYNIFQLDGTAYPGNSGSPLFDPATGLVYGIINSGFVQGGREMAVSKPSGITYAIPAEYLVDFLRREKIPGIE